MTYLHSNDEIVVCVYSQTYVKTLTKRLKFSQKIKKNHHKIVKP